MGTASAADEAARARTRKMTMKIAGQPDAIGDEGFMAGADRLTPMQIRWPPRAATHHPQISEAVLTRSRISLLGAQS